MPLAHWALLSNSLKTARSSHSLAVTAAGHLIVYGGEFKPRIPVDNDHDEKQGISKGSLHAFDLNKSYPSASSDGWRILRPGLTLAANIGNSVPDARVGATAVIDNDQLYMWGGRGGVDMSPLPHEQAGIWKAKLANDASDAIHWEHLKYPTENAPDIRSYHCSVAHNGKIYIHAGCPTSGRLSTLHAFDIATQTWEVLADAPEPPRGGTALALVEIPDLGPILIRYGGFSGSELPFEAGIIDVYVINTNQWHTIHPTPDPTHGSPGSRSVHGLVSFYSPSLPNTVAALYHGERDASSLGHAGAGTFWDDVWTLEKHGKGLLDGWAWSKVDVPGDQLKPEGRGWFPPAMWVDEHRKSRIILQGGLLSSNERSGELWQLEIE